MKKSNYSSLLRSLGLSDNEVSVYLSALSMPATTITQLARAAGLKRTTAYSVVDTLKMKGLIRVEIKGFKKLYKAENPQHLKQVLCLKQEQLDDVLPDLLRLYTVEGSDSFIKYYEGVESVKVLYNEVLDHFQKGDIYYAIGHTADWHAIDNRFFSKYVERRARYTIDIRLLLQVSKRAEHYSKYAKNFNQEVRLLPESNKITTNILVLRDKVIFQPLHPPILALVVENKNIIETHKEMFEIMWSAVSE